MNQLHSVSSSMEIPSGRNKPDLTDILTFDDRSLKQRWRGKKVPMSEVYEAYVEGRVDIAPANWRQFFDTRHETLSFRLTGSHVKWGVERYLPQVAIHTLGQDKRIVSEHYNRGNDFFGFFLGEAMVYTAAYYQNGSESLEAAQDAKIDHVSKKMLLAKGERLLDIGCGWGTFVARAARDFGVQSYGVTLAEEQVKFGSRSIEEYGVEDRARVEVCDYRDIQGRFDKIVSLEMVEHVGIKNLTRYYQKVHSLLEDEGLFLVSWTGIRGLYNPQNPLSAVTMKGEDLIWALFMNRYIFPGADASLTLSGMIRAAEASGFEVADVENVSQHYVITLRQWCDLWESNRDDVVRTYGERWYRLWHFFLYWSALIGEQGSAFNYHLMLHKNHESYNRKKLFFNTPWR